MYLEKLNPQQRMAVEHGTLIDGTHIAGPLLVIAGAGSGKTNTLAHRVAHLIVKGADPRRILLMTFSRRAAAEMARRVERICRDVLGSNAGVMADALSWSGTFHGIGARLLRDYAEQIGLDPDFTIHDREDSADLMNLIRHDLGFSKTESRFPTKGTCLAIYSRAVNSEAALDLVLRDAFPWCATWEKQLRELFACYVEAKQSQNVLDYDDLLLYWAQMVGETVIAEDIGSRFDHVLVDEYQDTNRLQASILLALKPQGQGLTVVGDDAQSIYSFRAATVRNILDFPAAFSPAANIVTLDRNYRSTQPILAAANAVIDLASERFTKNLWTERQSSERPRLVTVRDEAEQARYITDMVLDNREEGLKLKQQAVLFRASHHSGPLEVELTRRNIPFVKFGGLKFLDSAHVKDMLAALRFAQNPRDRVAGFRLMQILPGVGPSTAQKALDLMAEDASPITALGAMPAPPRSGEDWTMFVSMLQELKTGKAGWPAEIGLARQWYAPHLERLHEDAATRQADLLQLEQIASGYASRERFLTELTLDPPDATSDQAGVPLLDEDYLILSTIHSAKGQEWTRVFMLNVVDGCIPSDLAVGTTAEIEEERRLLYVAMTRARDGLDLVVPQRFFTYGQNSQGDRHVYASRSRFIPATLLQFFEACSWPQGKSEAAQAQARQVRIDVGARMRGMWR
ncbi:ATP-dependent helicase [Rhizobium ruizarguesonis]|uniref:DNA 3'-5' helicase n=1 Tax=Rhizobium ruizarguesonis TaxID=2081791 RepID=A0AAE4YMI2_9HYPH|nr:ATP-dependent helicase [Rhizobium ruizarguesonis]TCA29785.1 ATP-dependent helicase [Rhizobium leguminosarum bv. viciae]MCB2403180.1 ATP-dependent helicase [Rhizobium ruizarguesonis]NEI46658.1 AAA family ATPase [Rhizobium ruizarguesonis]NEJ13948.1 AAA family ATPase [Rhizobium ruizarguesonis]NEK28321.1 AAA family ATPase [Rhizobium ruizarguesonis]